LVGGRRASARAAMTLIPQISRFYGPRFTVYR
jgi:hypothetical protein